MSKPLKDLPGFDAAMAIAISQDGGRHYYDFDAVGDVVIPGLSRAPRWTFFTRLALMIGLEKENEGRRLRVVPTPKQEAANDV